MKITVVCHGNIARSQVLHHYLKQFAAESGVNLQIYSCGTAPIDLYPDAEALLADVRDELARRGLNVKVRRNILDERAREHFSQSDCILAADHDRKADLVAFLDGSDDSRKIQLFYEFIGEGVKDFVDTYDAEAGAQDPDKYRRCFSELERIARKTVQMVATVSKQ